MKSLTYDEGEPAKSSSKENRKRKKIEKPYKPTFQMRKKDDPIKSNILCGFCYPLINHNHLWGLAHW